MSETLDSAKIAYTIPEAVKATGMGRSTIYKLIASNELPVIKVGKRTLLRRTALEGYFDRLEAEQAC